jgi:hypothetical protein
VHPFPPSLPLGLRSILLFFRHDQR